MALLNVSEILNDVDMTEVFTVQRRAQIVDTKGRAQTNITEFPNVRGVLTANSPSDLDRREDYQNMSRSISVVCKFELRGETTGFTPDIIVWKGNSFIVKHVDSYPQFGEGFFQAECSSMKNLDPAFEPAVTGQLKFNIAGNAANVSLIR